VFRYSGPANTVNLAGEFNSWSTSADPMKKQADGSWTLTKALSPGRYMYKFVVDGSNWKEDPTAKETAVSSTGSLSQPRMRTVTHPTASPMTAAAAAGWGLLERPATSAFWRARKLDCSCSVRPRPYFKRPLGNHQHDCGGGHQR